jgi:NitT/TauT family transport system permease protein
MRQHLPPAKAVLPLLVLTVAGGLWYVVSRLGVFPPGSFPSPGAVAAGFAEEVATGRLFNDIVASLFRVSAGFLLAVLMGVPFGLWLGHCPRLSAALMSAINFFRNLSPLSWIPFTILWFGIGDVSVVFLIFMSTFFTLVVAMVAAVANIPAVFFRVGQDYDLRGFDLLLRVKLPATLPQIITAVRVAGGIAWMVVVAAEMIAGRDGLGFAIWDARNGLRTDLLVCEMVVIGVIGVALDWALSQMMKIPSVRWGYER